MTYKSKYLISKSIGVVGMIAPIATIMVVNREEYFTTNSSIDLSFGCIVGLVSIVLLLSGKSAFLKGLTGWAVFFLLTWFLRSILNDLVLISGMALSGATSYEITNALFIKKYKNNAEIENKILVENKIKKEVEDKLKLNEIKELEISEKILAKDIENNVVISGRV